jgi:hypothetical protein
MSGLLLAGNKLIVGSLDFTPARSAGWAGGTSAGDDPFLLLPSFAPASPAPYEKVMNTDFAVRTFTEPGTLARNYYLATFLSLPLAAQTIAGTLTVLAYFKKSSTSTVYEPIVTVRVLTPTGAVRGTLLALASPASQLQDMTTSYKLLDARGSLTLTSVSALAGDRLSVELGFRTYELSGSSATCSLRAGNQSANGSDPGLGNAWVLARTLAETQSAPAASFSQALTFLTPVISVRGRPVVGTLQTGTTALLVDGSSPGPVPEQDSGQTWPLGQQF